MTKRDSSSTCSGQSGMTLIEVMVSVFVLAIGMLGMAALMTSSKQAGYEATQRGLAVALAQDMIGRIRNNPEGLPNYDGIVVGDGSAGEQDCSNGATCSTAQIVAYDTYSWEQALMGVSETSDAGLNAGGLVSPTACVTVAIDKLKVIPGEPTQVAGRVTVAIAWRGLQVLSNPTSSACGEGAGLYGDNDSQRQVLVMESYVSNFFSF